MKVVALSAGGVMGVNARYWLGLWMNRWAGVQFPWATFAINVSGSFAIGFSTVALTRWLPHPNARLLVITGFLGGYTTFSTFEFDSATLWERGERGPMLVNMVGSVAAGFVAVLLGISLARAITTPSPERAPREGRPSGPGAGAATPRPLRLIGGEPLGDSIEPRSPEAHDLHEGEESQGATNGRKR